MMQESMKFNYKCIFVRETPIDISNDEKTKWDNKGIGYQT